MVVADRKEKSWVQKKAVAARHGPNEKKPSSDGWPRTLGQGRVLGSACLGLCAISTIALVSDWACLHDMAREYPAGLDISGEMFVLRLGLAATCAYLTYQIGLSAALAASLKRRDLVSPKASQYAGGGLVDLCQ